MKTITSFYQNKKVLITGHTGFKGSWLLKALDMLGAQCYGVSDRYYADNLYSKLNFNHLVESQIFDISDYFKLEAYIKSIKPDIIFHLAAQSLVLESYQHPYITYKTNVLGTLNVCEIIKNADWKLSFICVTTDKVYKNKEQLYKYKETDELNGFDPYSNSKSCADMLTATYINSLFNENVICSICRSGNVIGGGDSCDNRIVPDLYRAVDHKTTLLIRSKDSIRPYQHVLEANFAYLLIAMQQYQDKQFAGTYNIAPDNESILTTSALVEKFMAINDRVKIEYQNNASFHEAKLLLLDNAKLKQDLKWRPVLTIDDCVAFTDEWFNALDKNKVTEAQINKYLDRWGKNNE